MTAVGQKTAVPPNIASCWYCWDNGQTKKECRSEIFTDALIFLLNKPRVNKTVIHMQLIVSEEAKKKVRWALETWRHFDMPGDRQAGALEGDNLTWERHFQLYAEKPRLGHYVVTHPELCNFFKTPGNWSVNLN